MKEQSIHAQRYMQLHVLTHVFPLLFFLSCIYVRGQNESRLFLSKEPLALKATEYQTFFVTDDEHSTEDQTDTLVEFVDMVMKDQDLNDDGFIDYPEYINYYTKFDRGNGDSPATSP